MIVVFGGAVQGKTEFVKKTFDISDNEIFICDEHSQIKTDAKVIAHLERFIYKCIHEGVDPMDYFEKNNALFKDGF